MDSELEEESSLPSKSKQPRVSLVQRFGSLWVFLGWGLLVAVSLASHTILPIDETRYATVAWNMWERGDFLLPWLNNAPYADKPPLLFWIIQAAWALTGVNEWSVRLGPSLVGLFSTLLTGRIARRLWPSDKLAGGMAQLILLSCLWWEIFSVATFFDMLVACATLLAVLGLIEAVANRMGRALAFCGFALGLGLLAKGPAILLHVLPVALAAPWWAKEPPKSGWRAWYLGLLVAILTGAGIVLAWAIPAALRGGPSYAGQIFWGQTAHRMVQSFAHKAPFWWYGVLAPAMTFPWLVWPAAWSALARLRFWCSAKDSGLRLCVAWVVPVFIAFSCISGKQPQYLLPLLPAFALGLARLLSLSGQPVLRKHQIGPSLVAFVLALGLSLVPVFAPRFTTSGWIAGISPFSGVGLALCGLAMLIPRRMQLDNAVASVAALGLMVVLTAKWALIHRAGDAFDLRPVASHLHRLEQQGVPLAHEGKYHGQFQFLGRLEKSPDVVEMPQISEWFKQHPEGMLITYLKEPPKHIQTDYTQRFRGQYVSVLGRDAWAELQSGSR